MPERGGILALLTSPPSVASPVSIARMPRCLPELLPLLLSLRGASEPTTAIGSDSFACSAVGVRSGKGTTCSDDEEDEEDAMVRRVRSSSSPWVLVGIPGKDPVL